jgi:CheY-specific phosphatase CheX
MGLLMSEKSNTLQSSLAHAIARTMENMSFEEIEVVDVSVNPEVGRDAMWASLPILQPMAGEVVIELSRHYGIMLAKEVFGLEPDSEISDESVNDVIAEILNTMAGRFVDDLLASQFKFELGLPSTGRGRAQLHSKPAAAIVVNVGEHYMTATVIGPDFEKFTSIN